MYFFSGRLISDNVLVAFETLHCLKRKTNGKVGQMALKLDMSKTYNRVEWEFLERVMRHFWAWKTNGMAYYVLH